MYRILSNGSLAIEYRDVARYMYRYACMHAWQVYTDTLRIYVYVKHTLYTITYSYTYNYTYTYNVCEYCG